MLASDFPPNADLPARRRVRLRSIDVLRGVAALSVLIYHSYHTPLLARAAQHAWAAWLEVPVSFGRLGVSLFLVISGFCIHMGYAGSKGAEPLLFSRSEFAHFWRRRIARLYPPYVVTVLVSFIIGLTYALAAARAKHQPLWPPAPFEHGSSVLADLVSHLFLLQLFFPDDSARAYNLALWSLALEEQLYLLYTPLLVLIWRFGLLRALLLCLSVTLLWRSMDPGAAARTAIEVNWLKIGPARWFEWALGLLALEVYWKRVQAPAWLAAPGLVLALLLGAAWVDPEPYPTSTWSVFFGDIFWGLAFFAVVLCFTGWEARGGLRGRWALWLAWVGEWSYSLYLIHVPALSLSRGFLRLIHMEEGVLMHAGCPLFALASGYFFFRWVEQPLMRRFRGGTSPAPGR